MTKMELPVGPLISTDPAQSPPHTALHGRHTSLVPLRPEHSASIFKHLGGEDNFWRWTYMLTGGFPSAEHCDKEIAEWSASKDPLYYAVMSGPESDPASEPAGLMAYLNIVPGQRRIEIGCIILGEALKQSREATEAFSLFIGHAFTDLGYRRVEWKANRLNKPSLAAAGRLGFTFEGVFRKHMIIQGRSRDTAWYSITDDEWHHVQNGFNSWLDDGNFDEQGKQRRGLKECREGS